MAATNAGLALGGMTNCCFRCGLRMVFERPPDRVIADALDDIQLHDFVFQQTQGPSRAPFRRLRTGQGDQFRRPGAIEDARSGGGGRVFALQHGLEAFFHQLPPRPGDGRKAGVQRRSDPAITPGLPGWRGVHLQQDARLRQLLRRVLAAVDQALQLFTLVRTELHNVLLYGDFPRDYEPDPTFIAKPSILTIYSLSMTQY